MRITTAMNHRDRLLSQVAEIFHFARICGWSNSEIREKVAERIYGDDAWKKLPGWASARVSNKVLDEYQRLYSPDINAARLERLLAGTDTRPVEYVRWQLRVDGAHVTSNQISQMRADGDENVWYRVEGAHIWNHRPDQQPYSDDGWRLLNGNEEVAA